MGTRRQRKVWLLSDCCWAVVTGMFCSPVNRTKSVNAVRHILNRAVVPVKAVLSVKLAWVATACAWERMSWKSCRLSSRERGVLLGFSFYGVGEL